MQRIAGFVARVWAKIGKMPHAMQRIAGFVARVWAKIGKMPHAMQRIAGFVARIGAQQGEKVLCVQCMQRIHGFVARPAQKAENRHFRCNESTDSVQAQGKNPKTWEQPVWHENCPGLNVVTGHLGILAKDTTMKRRACFLIGSVVTVIFAAGVLTGQQATKNHEVGDKSRDREAIVNAGHSFIKAFVSGDASALAAHWTENGEYYADDGTILRGRGEIEKAYAVLFAKKTGRTEADIEMISIRFPSKDTAIEEGYFKVRSGKQVPVSSKYTVLHVRENGKWLMAVVREWPSEGVSLRDLEWLIGTWEARHGDTHITTAYEWWGDKTFIRVNITLKKQDRTITGFQMIGKDRSTGQLRSWTFDPEGSFGEAGWSRDGRKWVQESAAVLAGGSTLTATNIMTPIDKDSFTFQSVHRTVDGEEVSDIPPVRVIRVTEK
jgi:uncharacterized protein (TIGR02246 family)